MIDWLLPLVVKTPNLREHWTKTYARNRTNRRIIESAFVVHGIKPTAPCHITLQREYNPSIRQKKLDSDNLQGALKGVRDTISGIIVPNLAPGQADHERYGLVFHYEQKESKRPGIRIIIEQLSEMGEND